MKKKYFFLLSLGMLMLFSSHTASAILVQDQYQHKSGGYSFNFQTGATNEQSWQVRAEGGSSGYKSTITPQALNQKLIKNGVTYKVTIQNVRSKNNTAITDWDAYVEKQAAAIPGVISMNIQTYSHPEGYTASIVSAYQVNSPFPDGKDVGNRRSVREVYITKDLKSVFRVRSQMDYGKTAYVKNPYEAQFKNIAKSFRFE